MKMRNAFGLLAALAAINSAHLACDTGNTANKIGKEEAEQIALKELPHAYIVGESLEMDLDREVYRIHIQNGEEARRVTVDVATGRLLEVKDVTDKLQEAITNEENVPEPVSLAHRDAAEYAALRALPGTVRKWKMQRENGRLIYKFNVVTGNGEEKRVIVEARSREILGIVPVMLDNR